MALAGSGFCPRRLGVLSYSGTAEDQSGAIPPKTAAVIHHFPTSANSVLVLLRIRTLTARWVTRLFAGIVDKGVKRYGDALKRTRVWL